MLIREIVEDDIVKLLDLYTELHDNKMPIIDSSLQKLWTEIISDKNHYIIVGEKDKQIIASCVLIVVPNLTHSQRPYALIENVITRKEYRNKGYATMCLNYAKSIAIQQNCYKIMLLTGSKQESTLKFYEKCGYNSNDKTALYSGYKSVNV